MISPAAAETIPGISILVDDLVRVRGLLSGISGARTRRLGSVHSGAREVRLRGRGMEYEESRAYVSGDDFRTMDWRVMARTGEAHTKVFAEEKERRFLLAVDLSASMYFGTRNGFKSWAAAQVAAHAGWLATFAGERVGGLIVTPSQHSEIRPGKTRSGLLRVFHHLARTGMFEPLKPPFASRLGFLLSELKRVAKPGTNIALISDFMGIDEQALQTLSAITRHNQVSCYWIHDDCELEDWPAGRYPLLTEQGGIELDLAAGDTRAWLRQQQREHRERVEGLCTSFNLPLLPISCNRDVTPQILRGLGL
jgi:uncharacterized protein (DUF58 family)